MTRFGVLSTLALLTLTLSAVLPTTDAWTYWGDEGPDNWPGVCTEGENQSPIDIPTDDAIKTDLGSLRFTRYDFAFGATVANTGHTIQITPNGVPIHLSGGNLPSVYVLEQMHFHWSSEHTIDGEQDALELHFVHYAKEYDNTTYASNFEQGVAVVAVLFELSNEDNEYFNSIIDAVNTIVSTNATSTRLETKLIPSMFLPKDHSSYYRYYGSLTTPECQEGVIWSVLSSKMTVSLSQIESFRKIWTSHGYMTYNNRPVQPLGSRKVYHHLEGYSGASSSYPTMFVVCGSLLLAPHGNIAMQNC